MRHYISRIIVGAVAGAFIALAITNIDLFLGVLPWVTLIAVAVWVVDGMKKDAKED